MNRPKFSSPKEIAAWLAASVPEGVGIMGASLFCRPEEGRTTMCLVDADDKAVFAVSRRLDGQRFGTSSVAVALPLTGDFTCRSRNPGQPLQQHCSCSLEP